MFTIFRGVVYGVSCGWMFTGEAELSRYWGEKEVEVVRKGVGGGEESWIRGGA